MDFYRFDGKAGDAILAEIVSSALDTILGLMDASGNVIVQDDDSGKGELSRIAAFLPSTGTYYLAVSTDPDIEFDGGGSGTGRYVLNAAVSDRIALRLTDDGTQEVGLPFTFPYQGRTWSTAWVNANGNVTFGGPGSGFSESPFGLVSGNPRIAALWDDLSPQEGEVFVEADATSWTVRYVNVPQYLEGDSNTFSIRLSADGGVTITYDDVTALDGIAGVSEGADTPDPGETDLSAGASLSVTGTTYEEFTGATDPFDLDGTTLTFEP